MWSQSEQEVQSLKRKLQLLEGDLDRAEDRVGDLEKKASKFENLYDETKR